MFNNIQTLSSCDQYQDVESMKRQLEEQAVTFQIVNTKLVHDLAKRSERVAEVEHALEIAHASSNNKATYSNSVKQKMAFLQRNVHHLTSLQKSMVERMNLQQVEISTANQKLDVRNDRISELEMQLEQQRSKIDL